MPLKSKLLSGDPQLEACLLRDSAHITQGARGAHVGKIQQALSLLDGARISPAETSPQNYGSSTAAAVLAYKKQRKIINSSYETSEDNIVGKLTIARLDSDMVKRELPGPNNPLPPLTIIPFTEATPLLISKKDDSRSKNDLTSTPVIITGFSFARRVKIQTARLLDNSNLRTFMFGELQVAAGAAGVEAAIDFFANLVASKVITKGVSTLISGLVKAAPEFRAVNDSVKTFVTEAIAISAATGILDYHVLAEPKRAVPPPGLSFGTLQMQALIGSFQGVRISLESFTADAKTRRYSAGLLYEWFDHFGVDDGDLDPDFRGHGTPGQIALWVLQRERPPQNRPYVLRVLVTETISDKF